MDLELITRPLVLPDLKEIKLQQEVIIERGKQAIQRVNGAVVITSIQQQATVLELLRDIRGNIKAAKTKFKEVKDPLNVTKKALDSWEHEMIDPWELLEGQLSVANSNFILSQKREADEKRKEQQRAAEEEARRTAEVLAKCQREERERLALIEAAKLEAQGYAGAADATLEAAIAEEQPIVVPAPVVASYVPVETAKVAGISSRANYSCKVVDLAALVRHCVENPALILMFLTSNDIALNAQARALKDNFQIPGCELVMKYV